MAKFFDGITKMLDDFIKEIEEDVAKHPEKYIEIKEEKMHYLDPETEALLKELLEDENFPNALCDKFIELQKTENGVCVHHNEDERLRIKLKPLIDGGYITLHWGSGVPHHGRIEQKGRSYFAMKEQEETRGFTAWEKLLYKLLKVATPKGSGIVSVNFIQLSQDEITTFRKLEDKDLVANVRWLDPCSGYVGFDLPYDAVHYFEERNAVISDYIGGVPIVNTMNIYGNVTNSNIQQAAINSSQAIEIFPDVKSIVTEIRKAIDDYKLSTEDKAEVLEMAEEAERASQEKKSSKLKRVLFGIGGILKDFAVGVAASFLAGQIM